VKFVQVLNGFAILAAPSAGRLRRRLAELLKPGVDFLGKWMGLFLAPASAPILGLVDTKSFAEGNEKTE
jgi:hypothetical protein